MKEKGKKWWWREGEREKRWWKVNGGKEKKKENRHRIKSVIHILCHKKKIILDKCFLPKVILFLQIYKRLIK